MEKTIGAFEARWSLGKLIKEAYYNVAQDVKTGTANTQANSQAAG